MSNKITKHELHESVTNELDKINVHKDDKNNPHNVTASQVGAYTTTEVDNKIGVLTDEVTTHKNDAMPHKFTNLENNKTYRWGLGQDAGGIYFAREEVI